MIPSERASRWGCAKSGRVFEELRGRRVVLVGFTPAESDRMASAFARVHAATRSVDRHLASEERAALTPCDLVVLAAGAEPDGGPWPDDRDGGAHGPPVLLVADPGPWIRNPPRRADRHLLLAPWTPEGLLLRAWMAIRYAGTENAGRDPRIPVEIVLADDDPTIVALVEAALRTRGVRAHVARDGIQALKLARKVHPSAVIVDVNMPGRDGYDVLAAIRRDPRFRRVPVILLTARRQEADIVRGFELGAADYVVKPFIPMELVARLRRLLT